MRDTSGVSTSRFSGNSGGTEHFIAITPPSDASLEDQIAFVDKSYRESERQR
jgi:hypothetical protein